MFHLEKLFGKLTPKDKTLDKDKIARMLKDRPEALEAFEQAYTAAALAGEQTRLRCLTGAVCPLKDDEFTLTSHART